MSFISAQRSWGKWLQAWFGFGSHLALFVCFMSYKKWVQREKHPSNGAVYLNGQVPWEGDRNHFSRPTNSPFDLPSGRPSRTSPLSLYKGSTRDRVQRFGSWRFIIIFKLTTWYLRDAISLSTSCTTFNPSRCLLIVSTTLSNYNLLGADHIMW